MTPLPSITSISFPAVASHLILKVRPAPNPTLFPYTTLFRSADHRGTGRCPQIRHLSSDRTAGIREGEIGGRGSLRSEEHTSELQSHSDLVCRLLLEKKKTRQNRATRSPWSASCRRGSRSPPR